MVMESYRTDPTHTPVLIQARKQWIGQTKRFINLSELETVVLVREFLNGPRSQAVFGTKHMKSFISSIKKIYVEKCAIYLPEEQVAVCGGQDNYNWIHAFESSDPLEPSNDGSAASHIISRYSKEGRIIFYVASDATSTSRTLRCLTNDDVPEDLQSSILNQATSLELPDYVLSRYDVESGVILPGLTSSAF
jgi:hypothetical protein